ncbi:MAG TPA: AsmA-like C-terminal region-containing protein [Flavipsychrobacter sp.]|nr:AsmA-like C-terminal region-containing protein [Flavipsychrobacter sp.]
MPRWLKITFIVFTAFFGLIVILWLGLAAYVHFNKKGILQDVTSQLNDNLTGKLTIEEMDPTLLRGFPGVAISLKNVALRDSLWHVHKKDLLVAKNIYVAVDAFSLLKGKPKIKDVNIENARIYLYVDSTGYSNADIFRLKQTPDTANNTSKAQPRINHLTLTDVDFKLDNLSKKKRFHFAVDKVVSELFYNDTGWNAQVDIDALVKEFAFNTHNGSFIKNKQVQTSLDLGFNENKKVLTIPAQDVKVDDVEVNFRAQFNLDTVQTFRVELIVDAIPFREARSMLSENIQGKLKSLDFEEDIQARALIAGSLVKRGDPLVNVKWIVKDNEMTTPGGKITNCNMEGSFVNNANPAFTRNDRNSVIAVPKLTGKWNDIAFTADSLSVVDLIDPLIAAHITSDFPLSKINQIVPTNLVNISKGNGSINVFYRGGLKINDPRAPYIKGFVKVTGLTMTYLPRNLTFTNSTIHLDFTGSDLYLRNSKVQAKTSVLYLEGSMLNFLNLYYVDPAKIVLDLRAKSSSVNLEEFQSLLSKRQKITTVTKTQGGKNLQKAAGQLDAILDKSNLHLNLVVGKLQYKKFLATDIKADVSMTETAIRLNSVSVRNSGGNVAFNAIIDQSGQANAVTLNTAITKVDVTQFFTALENFGQDAITDKNIKGQLTASADMKVTISDAGKIIPGSMHGAVDFNLQNGALVNFDPIKNISKFVFRSRHLDNITFSDLKNTLILSGDKITINPMYIESSAINLNVEGVYGLKNKGTDIRVDVPLRNPKKDEHIIDDDERKTRNMKGIVIHLQAVNGDDGNVKIRLRSKGKQADAAVDEATRVVAADTSAAPSNKKRKGLFKR